MRYDSCDNCRKKIRYCTVFQNCGQKRLRFAQIAANHSLLNLFKGKLKPMKNKIL